MTNRYGYPPGGRSAAPRRAPRTLDAVRIVVEELELPFPAPEVPACTIARDPLGTFPACPMCGGEMRPEHAHYRCACGWRDSCCD
jgi:hypothetical protein